MHFYKIVKRKNDALAKKKVRYDWLQDCERGFNIGIAGIKKYLLVSRARHIGRSAVSNRTSLPATFMTTRRPSRQKPGWGVSTSLLFTT